MPARPVVLLLDNYDSFTYNLAQYLGELGVEPTVLRNDAVDPAGAVALGARAIVISPGPGTPADAGISVELIHLAAEHRIPLLGVCLGHQALGAAFGGRVIRADRLMHGKSGRVSHGGTELFAGLPSPLEAMRYHSLVVSPEAFPGVLEVTAWSADRPRGQEIMACRHRERPLWGVQFHPESIATVGGLRLISNFLSLAGLPPQTTGNQALAGSVTP